MSVFDGSFSFSFLVLWFNSMVPGNIYLIDWYVFSVFDHVFMMQWFIIEKGIHHLSFSGKAQVN